MADSTTLVTINGETREVATSNLLAEQVAPGHFLVAGGSRVREYFASTNGLSDGNALDGLEIDVESEKDRIIRQRFGSKVGAGGTGAASGAAIVKAPMPGLVRAVLVGVGDVVEKATTVIVLEAMKMENNIGAGAKGKVARILVEAGATVDKNAKLLEIETA